MSRLRLRDKFARFDFTTAICNFASRIANFPSSIVVRAHVVAGSRARRSVIVGIREARFAAAITTERFAHCTVGVRFGVLNSVAGRIRRSGSAARSRESERTK